MILMREIRASRIFKGGCMTSYKNAVDAEANAEFFLIRFDVNVRRAAAQCIDQ
jgi:hypothetical protein